MHSHNQTRRVIVRTNTNTHAHTLLEHVVPIVPEQVCIDGLMDFPHTRGILEHEHVFVCMCSTHTHVGARRASGCFVLLCEEHVQAYVDGYLHVHV